MTKEDLARLVELKAKSTQGRVKAYVGRENPARIDLVSGENVIEKIQEIEALSEQIKDLTQQRIQKQNELKLILHSHPVSPQAPKELSLNAENDMNYVEELMNQAGPLIELAERALK
jgi:hypothetical protein